MAVSLATFILGFFRATRAAIGRVLLVVSTLPPVLSSLLRELRTERERLNPPSLETEEPCRSAAEMAVRQDSPETDEWFSPQPSFLQQEFLLKRFRTLIGSRRGPASLHAAEFLAAGAGHRLPA